MRRSWALGGLVAVVVAGALLAGGVVTLPGMGGSARPPCEQLPGREEVAAAIAAQPPLVSRLEGLGSGVSVTIATPCRDLPDRAIGHVAYETDEEKALIDSLLARVDGFGVPLEVVKK